MAEVVDGRRTLSRFSNVAASLRSQAQLGHVPAGAESRDASSMLFDTHSLSLSIPQGDTIR
jgi:hypothetical protein